MSPLPPLHPSWLQYVRVPRARCWHCELSLAHDQAELAAALDAWTLLIFCATSTGRRRVPSCPSARPFASSCRPRVSAAWVRGTGHHRRCSPLPLRPLSRPAGLAPCRLRLGLRLASKATTALMARTATGRLCLRATVTTAACVGEGWRQQRWMDGNQVHAKAAAAAACHKAAQQRGELEPGMRFPPNHAGNRL